MNGKSSLTLTSVLFAFATLAACGGGGSGGAGSTPNPTPTPNPPPGSSPNPTPSPGPQASAIAVPKTGQTTCYDPNGTAAEVSCANTGQDGELQTGVAAPSPRFTIDNSGDCVTDNLTGLMWTRNANLPAGNTDPTQQELGRRTWQAALNFANDLDLCGFSDWRLPNRNELRSLINHQEENNSLRLNELGFSRVTTSYWTSTSYGGNRTSAWLADTAQGRMLFSQKTQTHYVWPVRAGQ